MRRKKTAKMIFAALILLALAFMGQAAAAEKETPPLDVHWEPSADEVVADMLALARVQKDDVVYDLGCGDGRVVIAAVQKGARGLGIDLDPQRIRESVENARKAKVSDRVRFIEQDLFQSQIGDATVVMLYLFPEVNLRLRPKLFRDLKPGTRVVSHSHDMGSWIPEQTLRSSNGHYIHYWVMPANLAGNWEFTLPGRLGKEPSRLRLQQRFQRVSGALEAEPSTVPLTEIGLQGAFLKFTAEMLDKGKTITLRFQGRVKGDTIEGTVESQVGTRREKAPWKARRDPSTSNPWDQMEGASER
jgi:SAM-dependent methyltransferase